MSAARKTPTGNARHWIAWKTKVLTDADVMMLPNIARMAFPYLLALSAAQGWEGRLPNNARALQVSVRCDGGVSEMNEALDQLLESGLLAIDEDDPTWVTFRGWASNQTDLGGSTTRRATAARSQPQRRHNEGHHIANPRETCALCVNEAVPAGPIAPKNRDMFKHAYGRPAPEEPDAEASDETRTIEAVLADFRTGLDTGRDEASSPYEFYNQALQVADRLGLLVSDLSQDAGQLLRDEVLSHALYGLVPELTDDAVVDRCVRGARALGSDGHKWYLHAAVLAATADLSDGGHLVSWLAKTARNERSRRHESVS